MESRPSVLRACALTAAALLLALPARAAPVAMSAADPGRLLVQHDYLALQSVLEAGPTLAEKDFYAGIVANRRNKLKGSLALLEPALAHPPKDLTPEELRIGYGALASSYVKLFRYADAAATFARIQGLFARDMSVADATELEEQRQTMTLLKAAPPQTAMLGESTRVPSERDKLGLAEIPVTIGGTTLPFVFDTGANFSLLTRSVAAELHLTPSTGHTQVTRAGGAKVKAQIAIIPSLEVGHVKFANVVALIVDDKDFYFPRADFQLRAVLGYPAISALGSVTIGRDGGLTIGPHAANASGTTSLWLDGLTPLIAVRADDEREQLYVLDSGTGHSYLSARFFEDNKAQFAGRTPGQIALGARMVPAYGLAGLSFRIGEARAALALTPVAAAETGTVTDPYYGIVGQDILNQFASYTLDFRAMTFSVGPIATPPQQK